MGMLQRFVDKTTLSEDYEDEVQFEDYWDEEEDEEPEVGQIHAVNPLPEFARIVTFRPRSFKDVRGFGRQFRQGVPVVLILSGADGSSRQRIQDFAAGVSFGLHGQLNQISDDVFLMTPHEVKLEDHSGDEDSSSFSR